MAFAFKIKFFVFVSLSRPPVDQLGGQRKDETPENAFFTKTDLPDVQSGIEPLPQIFGKNLKKLRILDDMSTLTF